MDVSRLWGKSGWSSLARIICAEIQSFSSLSLMYREFTVPMALWSLWWIPSSSQELSLMKSHLLRGAVSSHGTCIWNRADFGGLFVWWWLFLASEVTVISPELEMNPAMLFMRRTSAAQWDRAVPINHICHFYACLSLREGSFCLFNIMLKSYLAAVYFLHPFFPIIAD